MSRHAPLGRCLAVVVLSSLVALVLLDASQAQTDKGKKYALVVGVRDYDSFKLRKLDYTENDAEDLAEELHNKGGFSVRLLTTSRGNKRKTDMPTVANLRAEVRVLLAKKKRNDTVLVALAGHGIQAIVKATGKDTEDSFFCPADAQFNDNDTLLSLGKLFADLNDCGAGVKLLLVDACRNDPMKGRNADPDTLPRPPRGTAALFSCKGGERAFETDKLGSKGHGVFFHFVLEGLRGKARNEEGEVTWDRLTEFVKRQVSRQVPKVIGGGARQTPHLLANLEGESPILVAPSAGVAVREETPGKEEVVKGWGKTVESSIGMTLVRIPKSKFQMGSTKEELDDAIADYEKATGSKASDAIRAIIRTEGPRHEVEITKDFWLGVHEVTQKEFKAVMGYNPSYFSTDGEGKTGLKYLDVSKPAGGKDKVAGKSTDDFPVENVSYDEAVELCKKLSARDKEHGRLYRLPTEAEWEYSCRGGASSSPFHFGDTLSSKQANFNGNYPYGGAGKDVYLQRTCKVGSYTKNRFGLHDMHGNVWEWCSDWHDKDYYAKSPPRDPKGPSEGSFRVIRGGSWNSFGRYCRSAFRSLTPASRNSGLGFRVALVPSGR
jgi:formylglycine-generating enzyme required for sulfatase activity